MKWGIFSACLLILLSASAGVLFYFQQGFEIEKLVLSALICGTTPQEYIDITDSPYKKQIISIINASVVLGHEIEIPEHSPLRQWAETVLSGDNWRLIFIKIGEDQYYRVIVEYIYKRFSYPFVIPTTLSIITVCAWVVFALLAAKRK